MTAVPGWAASGEPGVGSGGLWWGGWAGQAGQRALRLQAGPPGVGGAGAVGVGRGPAAARGAGLAGQRGRGAVGGDAPSGEPGWGCLPGGG